LLLLTSYKCIMQAEFNAFLVSVTAMMLILNARSVCHFIGIILLGWLPFFKGISIVIAIQALLILFGMFNIKGNKLSKIAFGVTVVMTGIFLAIWCVYPREITDIFDALMFQSTFQIAPIKLLGNLFVKGIAEVVISSTHHMLLLVSLVSFITISIQKPLTRKSAMLLIAWLLGYIAVVIQGRYYVYHYVLLYLPMLFTLFDAYSLWHGVQNKSTNIIKAVWLGLGMVTTGIFLLNASPLQQIVPEGVFIIKKGVDYRNSKIQEDKLWRYYQSLPAGLDMESEVLYLDDGRRTWLMGMKSASRYYFPLPIQRLKYNRALKSKKCFDDMVEKLNGYKGKYIIWNEEWFDLPEEELFTRFRDRLASYDKKMVLDKIYLYVLRAD